MLKLLLQGLDQGIDFGGFNLKLPALANTDANLRFKVFSGAGWGDLLPAQCAFTVQK